jgi:hypothetical protein
VTFNPLPLLAQVDIAVPAAQNDATWPYRSGID